ncbi:hypothetical protein U0070_025341 [Myodes glareolus]|uniref:Uncharacterized protein n=1 Tax=Myodes glareolus TaxID=447135 RepID=A0AAW0JN99_MYOGA
MMAVKTLNPKAEVARVQAALAVNISMAWGLQDVLRTLDTMVPKGTMKILVSGARDIKLTKEGNVLLREMLIQHPRASLIAKVVTAQDDKKDVLTEAVVDSILVIKKKDEPIDLFMVKITEGKHKSETDTSLIRGIVLNRGARDPDMKKRMENAYILTCNVSLEYEKTEVNSGFFYKSAEEREKLVKAERKFIEDRVKKIIELRKSAGAVEVAMAEALIKYKPSVKGRAQLGIQAFADALFIIPKVHAQKSGFDLQETLKFKLSIQNQINL